MIVVIPEGLEDTCMAQVDAPDLRALEPLLSVWSPDGSLTAPIIKTNSSNGQMHLV